MEGRERDVCGGIEVQAVGGGEEDGHVLAMGGKGDEAEVVGMEGGGGGAGGAVDGAVLAGGGALFAPIGVFKRIYLENG